MVINMKTREQIYRQEAASLLRDITTYHCAKGDQLMRLYPLREKKIANLLRHLVRQGRIFYDARHDTYHDTPDMNTDSETITALWVLSDFGDKVEYHSTDTYPTKIIFFAMGDIYEIICVPRDKETLILHAASHRNDSEGGKRILIVEDIGQIERIDLPDAVFCTVDSNTGTVQYYKKEQEE